LLLDGGGQQRAIRRCVYALRRIAERDRGNDLAPLHVHDHRLLLGWSWTNSVLPSPAKAAPRGFLPALISPTTVSLTVSITLIVTDFSLVT